MVLENMWSSPCSYLEQSFTHVYIVEWSAQEKQTSKDEMPTLYFPSLLPWMVVHTYYIWHRVSSSPSVQFFPSTKDAIPSPCLAPWTDDIHFMSSSTWTRTAAKNHPKGSVCVLIGALSSWSFFILPWWLELSLCLPHRRNIWNTSCPRTISFHLRMRWFVSYRGGVCSRVLNGVVGSVVNGKEWKRGRDLMKN